MKELKISNPGKVLFPKDAITKMELIEYYIDICKKMLPFVENRLLSVIRCHKDIYGECFFKKHPTTDKNSGISYMDGDEEYFYVSKDHELLNQVQNGTLEFHVWASSITNIEQPNIMVFDLDPDTKMSLDKLRDAVSKVKSVLEELNLQCFLKTSGGKGYHIVVPFSRTKDWETFYDFSRQIAQIVENKWPKLFTTNIKKVQRKGKVFIDYLRNNRGSTCVSAYSVRARDGAPISFPIAWEDLNSVKPNQINIRNYKQYLNNSWDKFFQTNQKLK